MYRCKAVIINYDIKTLHSYDYEFECFCVCCIGGDFFIPMTFNTKYFSYVDLKLITKNYADVVLYIRFILNA